jgi:hypothetical protein
MGDCSWDHDDVIDRLSTEIRATRTRTSLKRWLVPFLIGFPLGGLIVLGTIGLLYYAGPELEAHFGPTIIKAAHVAGSVRRTPNELCWNTAFEKFDGRPPLLFSYFIGVRNYEIPVFAYRVNADGKKVPLSQPGFAHHDRGENWVSTYCLDLPETIDGDSFTVRGTGYYSSLTRLWRVPVELPAFAVDPNSAALWERGNMRVSRLGTWTDAASHHEPSDRLPAIQSVLELFPGEN